jgi:uncharacterized protein YecE (DUF72 family)
MAELRTGCADLPPRMTHERYFSTFDFLETTLCSRAIPTAKVLRRWRTAAPPRAYALVAPSALTATSGGTEAGVAEAFASAAAALDAAAVVFRTPPEVTPSAAGRDILRRLFGDSAAAERFGGRDRVWQPGGLWDLGTSARFAAELDVLCAIDPLAQDPGVDLAPALVAHLERGVAYLRPTGLGRQRARLAAPDLEAIAALIEPLERSYVVFANLDAPGTARAFRKVWAALAGEASDNDADDESDGDEEEPDGKRDPSDR